MRTETLVLWCVVVVRWLSGLPAGRREATAEANKPRPDESGFALFQQAPAEFTIGLMAKLGTDRSDKNGALHPVLRGGHLLAALYFSLLSSQPIAAAATSPPGLGSLAASTNAIPNSPAASAAPRGQPQGDRNGAGNGANSPITLPPVTVTGDLDKARDQIASSLGVVTYTIGPDQIQSAPPTHKCPIQLGPKSKLK